MVDGDDDRNESLREWCGGVAVTWRGASVR
jgi:hypothetical protein